MQEVNTIKFCKCCKNDLDISCFYEGLRRKVCINCIRKKSKEKWQRNREKILAFQKEKRRSDREEKEIIRFYAPVYMPSIPVNEETLELEDDCCEEFGCGKKLSLREKLFGNKCITHANSKPLIFHNGKL